MSTPLLRATLVASIVSLFTFGCGPGNSTVGGGKTGGGGGTTGSTGGGSGNTGGGSSGGCIPSGSEICGDNVDNDCNGQVDDKALFDKDNDGFLSCMGDCDDTVATVNPNAVEVANGQDDNCDTKVDNKIVGLDFDKDGYVFDPSKAGADCNDEEPLVGPGAIEVAGDQVDNNCNGAVDEPAGGGCDATLAANSTVPGDFAKAIGMCSFVTGSQFVTGNVGGRNIRAKFGTNFSPKEGSKMVLLSSGRATDDIDTPTYAPQSGTIFSFSPASGHPLYEAPRCGPGTSQTTATVYDMTEFKVTLKVPQNANSFSYDFNFFSAEYPEYVCTQFNDRFIAILDSKALTKTCTTNADCGTGVTCGGGQCQIVPAKQCITGQGSAPKQCNISYDGQGQPITINNGFFDVCTSYNGPNVLGATVTNTCTKPASLLDKTGYERADGTYNQLGGGTGWLHTKAPVVPGETITLRFIILDEGDAQYDSAVLIDNFVWDAKAVTAPTTDPGVN